MLCRAETFTPRHTASTAFTRIQLRSFNERITHILNIHKNALLGNQPWRFFGAYIFGSSHRTSCIFDFTLTNDIRPPFTSCLMQIQQPRVLTRTDCAPRPSLTMVSRSAITWAFRCQPLTIDYC
ncbi:hypothetical protein B0H14DRAFT_3852892 [Mycena olivaceomarginata]|nr:hypothetical protein B0H14DRAFT_3852892 [Mycena olivaceomarginata]